MALEKNTLANLRQDYTAQSLDVKDVKANPINQFEIWFEAALVSEILEPNMMTLATSTKDGFPSARIVLLKGFDENGFVFYTNYKSHKGEELAANPNAALVFCWLELQRQVCIRGTVEKVSAAESDSYFQMRPRGSQFGALASPQSQVIKDRQVLESNLEELQAEFGVDKKLTRPNHWGGYRVIPHLIEFWQGRTNRLHDRIQYTLGENNLWKIERLAP